MSTNWMVTNLLSNVLEFFQYKSESFLIDGNFFLKYGNKQQWLVAKQIIIDACKKIPYNYKM